MRPRERERSSALHGPTHTHTLVFFVNTLEHTYSLHTVTDVTHTPHVHTARHDPCRQAKAIYMSRPVARQCVSLAPHSLHPHPPPNYNPPHSETLRSDAPANAWTTVEYACLATSSADLRGVASNLENLKEVSYGVATCQIQSPTRVKHGVGVRGGRRGVPAARSNSRATSA